jgi:hypothetical protein
MTIRHAALAFILAFLLSVPRHLEGQFQTIYTVRWTSPTNPARTMFPQWNDLRWLGGQMNLVADQRSQDREASFWSPTSGPRGDTYRLIGSAPDHEFIRRYVAGSQHDWLEKQPEKIRKSLAVKACFYAHRA